MAGLAEGRAEGLAEGLRTANLALAAKLKSLGMPLAEIAELTELSLLELEQL